MTANSFYSRFKELYEEQERLRNDLQVLTLEAKDAVDDVLTLKRLARLAVYDKLKDEAAKYKKLKDMAEAEGEQFIFNV